MQDYRRYVPIWIAAIQSGYLKTPAWVKWAEPHVISDEPTQFWLVDLYQAKNAEEALTALYSAYRDHLGPPYIDYADYGGASDYGGHCSASYTCVTSGENSVWTSFSARQVWKPIAATTTILIAKPFMPC